MIKLLKILGWTAFSVFILFTVLCTAIIVTSKRDTNIAESPRRIMKVSGLKYSEYSVLESSNNLDRTSSAWTSYDYLLQVNNPSKLQEKVEDLVKEDSNWNKLESGEYRYELSNDSVMLSIYISSNCSTIRIDYSWWDFFS